MLLCLAFCSWMQIRPEFYFIKPVFLSSIMMFIILCKFASEHANPVSSVNYENILNFFKWPNFYLLIKQVELQPHWQALLQSWDSQPASLALVNLSPGVTEFSVTKVASRGLNTSEGSVQTKPGNQSPVMVLGSPPVTHFLTSHWPVNSDSEAWWAGGWACHSSPTLSHAQTNICSGHCIEPWARGQAAPTCPRCRPCLE